MISKPGNFSLVRNFNGLSVAAVVINTMPMWVAELLESHDLDVAEAGLTATLVLLFMSAGCLVPLWNSRRHLRRIAVTIACIIPIVLTTQVGLASYQVILICQFWGATLGFMMSASVRHTLSAQGGLKRIGQALSLGFLLSLLGIIISASLGWPVLWILAFICGLSLLTEEPVSTPRIVFSLPWHSIGRETSFLLFFVAMGAFWALLEVVAREKDFAGIDLAVLASLLISGIASGLVGRLARSWQNLALASGLFVAGLTGGIAYYAASEWLFVSALLVNSFALFLLLPLYINMTNNPPEVKAATYLLGLALGGLVGGIAVQSFGYTGLAVFLALASIPATAILWLWSLQRAGN